MSTSVRQRGKSQRPRKSGSIRGTGRDKLALPPVEIYSDDRIAEFLLNNAVDAADYARACADVRTLGIDPQKVKHHKPIGAA